MMQGIKRHAWLKKSLKDERSVGMQQQLDLGTRPLINKVSRLVTRSAVYGWSWNYALHFTYASRKFKVMITMILPKKFAELKGLPHFIGIQNSSTSGVFDITPAGMRTGHVQAD